MAHDRQVLHPWKDGQACATACGECDEPATDAHRASLQAAAGTASAIVGSADAAKARSRIASNRRMAEEFRRRDGSLYAAGQPGTSCKEDQAQQESAAADDSDTDPLSLSAQFCPNDQSRHGDAQTCHKGAHG